MFSSRKILDRQHGFTLVEMMVALLVFMVIMLGLARGEMAALLTQTRNLHRDEALRVAEDELSRLKSEQFSIQNTSSELDQTAWSTPEVINVKMRGGSVAFARSIQITDIASTAAAQKRIDVAVGWNQGNNATSLAPTNKNYQTFLSTIIVQSD